MLHSRDTTIHIYKRKHSQRNNDERTRLFRKIYLSLYSKVLRKGYLWEVSRRLNKTATYWPPAHLAPLLSRSVGLLIRGPWGPSSLLGLVLNASNCNKLTPTPNSLELPVAPGYIIVWHPPASVSVASAPNSTRTHSKLSPDIFDQMHLLFTLVHFLFDTSAGSEVNMLHQILFKSFLSSYYIYRM